MKDQLATNKIKLNKIKYKRKALVKGQEELEAKRAKLNDEVKDLEERIAAGRRGEEIEVDASFPDLLGADDLGIAPFLCENSGDKLLFDTIDLSVFD